MGSAPLFNAGADGALDAISHLGYVQIDTLSVIERAHHHVLWNRVPEYDPACLNHLVSEKKLFEYWFHAAAYLPMRDYRFALPRMSSIRTGESRYFCNGDPCLMKVAERCLPDGLDLGIPDDHEYAVHLFETRSGHTASSPRPSCCISGAGRRSAPPCVRLSTIGSLLAASNWSSTVIASARCSASP
ncbi:DNA glycosylase AlkZ-like family protein [Stenotrophomonas rhizophila]